MVWNRFTVRLGGRLGWVLQGTSRDCSGGGATPTNTSEGTSRRHQPFCFLVSSRKYFFIIFSQKRSYSLFGSQQSEYSFPQKALASLILFLDTMSLGCASRRLVACQLSTVPKRFLSGQGSAALSKFQSALEEYRLQK